MTTSLINLRTKDSGKSSYPYYKQKFGDTFEYIGDIDPWRKSPRWPRSLWYNPHHRKIKSLGRVKVVELYRV